MNRTIYEVKICHSAAEPEIDYHIELKIKIAGILTNGLVGCLKASDLEVFKTRQKSRFFLRTISSYDEGPGNSYRFLAIHLSITVRNASNQLKKDHQLRRGPKASLGLYKSIAVYGDRSALDLE